MLVTKNDAVMILVLITCAATLLAGSANGAFPPKVKIAAVSTKSRPGIKTPPNGSVVSTLHTLLQWEAKLPNEKEEESEIKMDDLFQSDDDEKVEFETDFHCEIDLGLLLKIYVVKYDTNSC